MPPTEAVKFFADQTGVVLNENVFELAIARRRRQPEELAPETSNGDDEPMSPTYGLPATLLDPASDTGEDSDVELVSESRAMDISPTRRHRSPAGPPPHRPRFP